MKRTTPLIVADLRSSGRLWAFAFEEGDARPLIEDDAPPGHGWAWSHFALSDNRSRQFIENAGDIPPAVRACLLGGEIRVQTHVADGWCFGVLPDFGHAFEGNQSAPGRLNFAFESTRLITTRRHALEVVDNLRREIESDALRLGEPADAIAAHVARFIDATELRLHKLSSALDIAEDHLLSDRDDVDGIRLGPMRRELSSYHREFAALRSVFHRATSHRGAARGGPLAERLPPLLLEIEDFDRDLAGQQDRARLLHDEVEAKVSAAANRSLRALTILSTLLLPPTLIVGAFGMNVEGIPFAHQHVGFWSASLLCVAVVGACYALLKQLRIL